MADEPFEDHRQAALALFNGQSRLTFKAGRFLGQLAVDKSTMSEKQAAWLNSLLSRARLRPLAGKEM